MPGYEGPNLRLYDSVLDVMLKSPAGDVGRYMRRVGNLIVTGGRQLAGVRTGNLRRSIHVRRHSRATYGQYIEVGSNLSYAYVHHEGSKPHIISPKPGRMLRFSSHGRMVYAHRVTHPGFRGRKYLTIPMRAAVRR